jgi:signal transduction histidine kinase
MMFVVKNFYCGGQHYNNKLIQYLKYIEALLHGSGSELSQVFLNILNNAKDILIEKLEDNRNIKIVITHDKKHGIIKIHDNAGGVPTDVLPKIFDPYFSTKSNNGTGLGLYMSKTIIEEHLKGDLSVVNDNHGAVFTIKLPLEIE